MCPHGGAHTVRDSEHKADHGKALEEGGSESKRYTHI